MPRIEFLSIVIIDQLFILSKTDSLLGFPGTDTLVSNGGDDYLVVGEGAIGHGRHRDLGADSDSSPGIQSSSTISSSSI